MERTGEMRRGVDQFDRDIVRHMLLWAPHGVLYDEDIFPEFGMNVQQFRRRFARVVRSLDSSAVDDVDRNLLDDARRYLQQFEVES
jgi:hypothetical protein